MKLYANGIRQTLINDLYYPLDLVINNYDETILIADSYDSSVLHYDQNNILLGYSYFYQGLFNQAITALQNALRLKPDYLEARLLLDRSLSVSTNN